MQMSVDDARQPLPPLVSVAAALCAVTEPLTRELASPQPAAPDWSEREHIARRQLLINELLATAGERFRRHGIAVQALKGTHRTFKHRVFEVYNSAQARSFGEHVDNAIKVELHERICEKLPHRLTDIAHLIWLRKAVAGLNPYLSRAALMAHLLLHAGNSMACRTLRLVQLHDIAPLARRLTLQDWQQLLEGRPWWVGPPLGLAERYYGASGPQVVTAALGACCPAILRRTGARQRLSEVSLSRLWLEAFPGIEWARSVGEAVTFIARRIVPSAEVRADRKFALTSDPALAHGDWGGLSQGRRILRALRARTPRPWPLHNVRAALAEPRSGSGAGSML
jgi:hypothetical protein